MKPRNPSNMPAKTPKPNPGSAPAARAVSPATFAVGTAFLLAAAAASGVLVVEHILGTGVPGCGPGGACEQAARSVWGKVPGINWPVSFLGLAYFVAAAVGWVSSRGALPSVLRWVARLGAIGSVFFASIILTEKLFCPYCIATHLANIGFWAWMESTHARGRLHPALWSSVVAFVAVSGAVGTWDAAARQAKEQMAEAARHRAAQEIIHRTHQNAATQSTGASTDPNTRATTQQAAPIEVTTPPQPTPVADNRPPFTGRYRRGPEQAPIRIVMFTDFQCRDCRAIEAQVTQIVATRTDVSLSMKHFPFCADCNPFVSQSLHPNACWAARAAEAAGILWGNDGFWKMFDHLFSLGGAFTTLEALRPGFTDPSLPIAEFQRVMKSQTTLDNVQVDCREAKALGIYFTPMIFINGVELKGWYAPNAVARTIAEIAATNPPPGSAANDHPPLAPTKCVEDWRDEPVRDMPPDKQAWRLGPDAAPVRIVMWGDYQEPGSAEADRAIRAFAASHPDASYVYRHDPFNSECNPALPYPRHVLACWAARLAEAAGRTGGNEAYWKVHAWLMDHWDGPLNAAAKTLQVDPKRLGQALFTMSAQQRQQGCSALGVDPNRAVALLQAGADAQFRAAAPTLGVDADALLTLVATDGTLDANILDDISASKQFPVLRYGLPPGIAAIPAIFINEKYVPRHQIDGEWVLDKILDAAAKQP